MIALDASVFIAHLNPADPHHRTAAAILLAGTPGQMLVRTVTLAEVLVGGVRIARGSSSSSLAPLSINGGHHSVLRIDRTTMVGLVDALESRDGAAQAQRR